MYTLGLDNLFSGDSNLRFLYMLCWLLKTAAFSSDKPCIALRWPFRSNLFSLHNGQLLLYLLLFFFSFLESVSLLFLKASHCWKILKKQTNVNTSTSISHFYSTLFIVNPFFRDFLKLGLRIKQWTLKIQLRFFLNLKK